MRFLDLFRPRKEEPAPRAALQPGDGGTIISTPAELDEFLRKGAGESTSGAVVTTDSAMRVAAVFRCVSLISGAVANMPLALKRRTGPRTREDASDHPLWALLRRRPNRWMTSSMFRRTLTSHVLLRGNAYALIVRSRGRVTELLPLHPDRTKVEQLGDLSLQYHYTRKDGTQVTFAQRDVFHLVGLSLDGINGVSVISFARNTMGLAIQTETHGARLFKNGATIGHVLKHPSALSDTARQHIEESLEKFRGAEQAHKTLLLEEAMDFEALGMTSEDAQFIETRQFQRREIAMFFGVPPHLIGDTEASTSWGTGIEQITLGFIAYTLQDWLTAWQETIDRDLVEESTVDLFARFNPAGLIRGDIKTRYGAYAQGRQWGWLSANDVRELEDMEPREDEDGDTFLDPMNMRRSGDPAEADENDNGNRS